MNDNVIITNFVCKHNKWDIIFHMGFYLLIRLFGKREPFFSVFRLYKTKNSIYYIYIIAYTPFFDNGTVFKM